MWDNSRSRRPLKEYEHEIQLMKQDFPKFCEPDANFQNFPIDQHFQNHRYNRNDDFNLNFNNFDYGPHTHQNGFESQRTFDQHGVGNQFENNFENDFQIDQNFQNYNPYQHLKNNQISIFHRISTVLVMTLIFKIKMISNIIVIFLKIQTTTTLGMILIVKLMWTIILRIKKSKTRAFKSTILKNIILTFSERG